jgi:hypothetical protein
VVPHLDGFKAKPTWAVMFYYLAEEFVKGNRRDTSNPFQWDEIRLNLPDSPDYDPSLPRVLKWVSSGKWIACDLVVFIDDLRGSGPTVELAWAVSRIVAARLQYLGIQDAARKRRPPTTSPGAWAGAVFRTSDKSVTCTVTQEKWQKAKDLVEKLHLEIKHAKEQNVEVKLNCK